MRPASSRSIAAGRNLFTPISRQRRRPEVIADRIKDLISDEGLRPGDRLPQEKELMASFKAAKGTVREAMKALETQGLITTRSGPGGGAFVSRLSGEHAMELLANFFFFDQPSLENIYAIRKLAEPEVAYLVAGRLSSEDLSRLERTMRLYDHPPADLDEQYRQRIAELDFHTVLAELCPNPVLGFVCGLMQNLLRNLAICRAIYASPLPELREQGIMYQIRLLSALRRDMPDEARLIAHEHMLAAEAFMLRKASEIRTQEQS